MSLKEAVELIISEAHASGKDLPGTIRRGEDPGTERMLELISALGTIFESLDGQTELDRRLAAALFTLGSDVPLTISSLASRGQSWRRDFMEDEVYRMLTGVQSVFEGRRLDPDTTETIH